MNEIGNQSNQLNNVLLPKGLRELHLFAGAGGGILGGILLGHTCVCAVEIEPYCRKVLLQRQRDGILPRFPIWDDVKTFDGSPWKGKVDVVCGGFPCQDISTAGRGEGITGKRSGLWKEMARIIREVQPRYVFVENSPALVVRGLGTVLGDLAEMGFNARWGVLGACHVGAPHKRERIWILAHSNLYAILDVQRNQLAGKEYAFTGQCGHPLDNSNIPGLERPHDHKKSSERVQPITGERCEEISNTKCVRSSGHGSYWFQFDPAEDIEGETDRSIAERFLSMWGIKSSMGRVAHGVANRVDRLKSIGNGQVPSVAALAWKVLSGG